MSVTTERSVAAPRSVPWPRLILPAVLTLLGLLILVLIPGQVVESATDPIGPRFVPCITGLAVLVGGVVDFIAQWRKKEPEALTREPHVSDGPARRSALFTSYALILIAILVWVYTTVFVGYAVSSLILMALTGLAFGLKKPVKMLTLSIVTVGITYYVFAELFQVQLPLIGW